MNIDNCLYLNDTEDIYLYDGTFYNLLNVIVELIKRNIKPTNIKDDTYEANIFTNFINLDVENSINDDFIKMITDINFSIIFHVFLSNNENKELIIFYFIKNALKYHDSLVYRRNLKCVREALKLNHQVRNECHRFKGFTRFKELKTKILFATINPENDILILLSKHFSTRLKNEIWIIKDVKRNKYSIYDRKKYYLITEEEFKMLNIDEKENNLEYENLWKIFYDTIGIQNRKNERCRMNFMPKKYWKYILEVSDEDEKNN